MLKSTFYRGALVALLALLALPVFAAAAQLGVDTDHPAAEAALPVATEAPILATSLPSALPWETPWSTVRLEIYADGDLIHAEEVEAQLGPEAGRAELMVQSPNVKQHVLELARGAALVEARVLLDGVEQSRGALLDLVVEPSSLESPFAHLRYSATPVVADSEGPSFVAAASCPARDSCYANCSSQRQLCIEINCGGGGGPIPLQAASATEGEVGVVTDEALVFCEPCESQYQACRSDCASITCECVDPADQYTTTSTTLVGYWVLGYNCYEDYFNQPYGTLYRQTQYQYRQDTIQVTEYCDGTSSSQVISSSYFTTTCNDWAGTCSWPFGYGFSGCY